MRLSQSLILATETLDNVMTVCSYLNPLFWQKKLLIMSTLCCYFKPLFWQQKLWYQIHLFISHVCRMIHIHEYMQLSWFSSNLRWLVVELFSALCYQRCTHCARRTDLNVSTPIYQPTTESLIFVLILIHSYLIFPKAWDRLFSFSWCLDHHTNEQKWPCTKTAHCRLYIACIFDAAKNIALHIVFRFKVSTIWYVSEQHSNTELYHLDTILIEPCAW